LILIGHLINQDHVEEASISSFYKAQFSNETMLKEYRPQCEEIPSVIVANSERDNFTILEGDPITIIVKEILKEHLPSKKILLLSKEEK